MADIKPLKGFRDFLPLEARKRDWLKTRLVTIFESWGYDPMETPTLEPLELFAGQIGEDEKLFYKFKDNGGRDVALRYDQTVPSARVIADNYQELPQPFKRYQIQAAFRAENPQKGRFREFLQADADIFGSFSPLADAEVIALSLDIYKQLGFEKAIALINDRSLLTDIPYSAISSIDKLEKLGVSGVIQDMMGKGITESKAKEYLNFIENIKPNETLETIFEYLDNLGFSGWYKFEPTLARSFSYSSGPIWEVKIPGFTAGSVLGGERYDSLVEKISGVNIPGTGFGLGFDRTLMACQEFNLIDIKPTSTQVLITIFSENTLEVSIKTARLIRETGINCELYPDSTSRLDKQLKYADKKQIPFVGIIGPEEIKTKTVIVKKLLDKTQEIVKQTELVSYLNKILHV